VGEDCVISGNVIYGIADGSTIYGIWASAAADMRGKNIVIANNVLYSCGVVGYGAISLYYTDNATIANNHCYQSYNAGIALRGAYRTTIIGNVIEDTQSADSSTYGIYAYADVTGVIDGNHIVRNNSGLNVHVGEIGIYVRASATSNIRLGLSNYITYTTPYSVSNAAVHWGEYSANTAKIYTNNATPEAAIAAKIGSLCINTAGGAGTTLYVKQSGDNTNTGWVGK
jgi:parallel beta-helix repeat protein